MNRLPKYPVALLLVALLQTGSLSGQAPSPPTSFPLENTLENLFPVTEGPCDLESARSFSNFRALLDYDADESAEAKVVVFGNHVVDLPGGEGRQVELAYEHAIGRAARVRVWHEGKLVGEEEELAGSLPEDEGGSGAIMASAKDSSETFRFDRDFTVMVKFRTKGEGPLVARAPAAGEWVKDGKMLFIREGRVVYDIGWLGAIEGDRRVNDGREHVVVLQMDGKTARMFVDGRMEAAKREFMRPDVRKHIFKIGAGSSDFGGSWDGEISNVRWWKRALSLAEVKALSGGRADTVNTPDYNWKPGAEPAPDAEKRQLVEVKYGAIAGYGTKVQLKAGPGFRLRRARVQPLEKADHAALVRGWDAESLARGRQIYSQLCVTCHGTLEKEGSLPTAMRFHEGQFRNGKDPYRMFQTLERGYGLMVPQPQYDTAQKYDIIHYLRETFLRGSNESQLSKLDEEYLALLPRGMTTVEERRGPKKAPQYALQDYSNVLFWTMQVEGGNIAQKGITIRVDEGPGGVVAGKAWMLYDHDTMRLAAAWTGDQFVDWRGIAFDGSHGTHTSISGERKFVFPNLPMWANPETGDYEDLRISGRDNKPYGPLPGAWVRFRGLRYAGDDAVVSYTVGKRKVEEIPQWNAGTGSFVRIMRVGAGKEPLRMKLETAAEHIFPPEENPRVYRIIINETVRVEAGEPGDEKRFDPEPGRRFPGRLVTTIVPGAEEGPFAIDVLPTPPPSENPWQSWMRTSGFDFFEGGKSAAICTWNGDVWIVDGVDRSEGVLQWQRICSGLFQPLGLRIVEGKIYVGCRDMIALLHDENGDRETDYVEVFNNDHQVTEHFHEFAMGLQTDDEGNFYYAKSARHALTAVVPHHGTLLRVKKDGSRTDILATGFRAANGVCLNPDGSFIVTDQEGHWNPKNRINWVEGKGEEDFYGNMFGYHGITDSSDSAMNPPLCWITNQFDRSPAELLWVPESSAWKSLRGSLLNLSYGYGKIYVVPHEKVDGLVQGGMCQLPFDQLPTGVMRGRFHPGDGQLYACGMFAWAGSQRQPGGFYRVRATGKPAHAPVGLQTAPRQLRISFSDPLDRDSAERAANWEIEAWDLKRTRNYGSRHYNQRRWQVAGVTLSNDGLVATLEIPDLIPTWGMSIRLKIRGVGGEQVLREIHNSIHKIVK
ncbi:MAG: hypothetical protein CMP27_09470 [Roseibacillus sp.]|nr:hypothetical protein [Roseibacillus sp.]